MGFNFIREILWEFTGEIPVKFRGISHMKSVTCRLILKKSTLKGAFEFFHPDSQLVQIFKPKRNLSGHFLYILYEYSV